MEKDMTKGNPLKLIVMFSIPILISGIFSQIYNFIDTLIVGRTVSSDAMAGVSCAGSFMFVVSNFSSGLVSGFMIILSQSFGSGDRKTFRKCVAASFELGGIISVLVMFIYLFLSEPVLLWLNTPEQYFDYAYYYVITIAFGSVTSMLGTLSSGIMNSLGDSKTPLYFSIIGIVLNIVLDLLFIIVFKLHYIGVALATVVSSAVSGILCFIYVMKKFPYIRPKLSDFKHNFKLCIRLIKVGIPMSIQNSIVGIGSMFYTAALNDMNAVYPGLITANVAAGKINGIFSSIQCSFLSSIATFVGQNFGAGRKDRIIKGVHSAMFCSCVVWIVGFVVCMLLCEPFTRLFIDPTTGDAVLYFEDMLKYSRDIMFWYNLVGSPLLGAVAIYRTALQCIGHSPITIIGGGMEVFARVLMAYFGTKVLGLLAIYLVEPFAFFCADIIFVPLFYWYTRRSVSFSKFEAE
ncbi:MAG: MATE family efflux transporter [Ruminococcaceae bacterium]|nr:MATE family efflux transporter [Oscillospiraceae bacterium]